MIRGNSCLNNAACFFDVSLLRENIFWKSDGVNPSAFDSFKGKVIERLTTTAAVQRCDFIAALLDKV
jgi:hypothetical protein